MPPVPRPLRPLLLALASLLLIAARERPVRLSHPAALAQDVFTFSEPSKIVVRHVSFDLTVNADTRELAGTATLDVQNFTGTDKLVLDTSGFEVHSVARDGHIPATFTLGSMTGNGAPLSIDIEPSTKSVTIDYVATRTAGVVWTASNLTGGPPFIFSNAEPTGTRTWLPIQDTPAVRVTYDATLHVPSGLLALMTCDNNPRTANDAGIYTFHMSNAIPSYLIAFAIGPLTFHAFDARTGVYGDADLVAAAATKLAYIPDVLAAAESLAGPYPFARYDILLMPPLYPGGMENPNLNFIDQRTLTKPAPALLITHELSHSWAGDMVTLADWPDTWLNEGLASYYELRLLEPFVSKDMVDSSWAAWASNATEFYPLHMTLTAGDRPGSAFNQTEYIKGALFFHRIETVAGRDAFDAFMRAYFARFAWHSLDDVTFLAFLRSTLLAGRPDLEQQLQPEVWLYQGGLPAGAAGDRQSFQVAAPQTIANSSAADDVTSVAVTGPIRSEAMPAKTLDRLIVSVTNP